MNADQLRQYLEFYQDLGIKTLYKQAAPAVTVMTPAAQASVPEMPKTPDSLPPLAPENDTLFQILADLGDCRRCRLHEGRTKLVFGVGNEKSPLVFVGEG